MSSGRHRRPEPDPLPEVDLAARLSPGPVVPATTGDAGRAPAHGRHGSRPAAPMPPGPHPPAVQTAAAPAVPGQTVVARRSRAAERAARRRAMRQRVVVVAAGVLGLVLVVVGGWLVLRGGGDSDGTVATTPARQLTTLVQVTGADGTAAASALVGTTAATKEAVAVLVPSRLIVDAAGSGEMPFGETVTLGEPAAPAAALTDLLGVSVDDSWVLSTGGLAALVDAVGGVQAAVDVDVVTTDAKGNETVVVRAGNQRLKGSAAAAYATYLADGEPEQARLARFDDVLTAVAGALPADHATLVARLAALGDGSRSTLDSTALADRLAVLRAAAADESLVSDVLPVTEIDTGGAVTSYGLDAAQAAATMRARFPGALQKDSGGESLRVLVENGVGTPGLVEKARAKLVAAGFRFVNGGNASPFNHDPSGVLVPDGTDKSLDRGRRVAAALGLPESSVQPEDRGQSVADVIVILGADFAP
jgi:anionic cell wall polymer biosynthesis LytR-Cps2A-Psr (LCP) family protein